MNCIVKITEAFVSCFFCHVNSKVCKLVIAKTFMEKDVELPRAKKERKQGRSFRCNVSSLGHGTV